MTTPPKARRYNTQAMASITPQTPPPAEPTASDSPALPRLEVARRSDAPASDASERQARLERFLATEPIDDGLGDFRLTNLRHKLLGETQFKLDEAERLSTMLGLTMAERDACFFDAENRFSRSAALELPKRGKRQ